MCPHQSAVHCQVSLVSRDEELCGLQSSVTACAVTRGHTTTSVITTARAAEIAAEWGDVAELSKLTPDKVIPGGELHLTSVTATNAAGYPVHSPPHTHFIKVTDMLMLTLFPVKSIIDFS